jgi:hypothetical protein
MNLKGSTLTILLKREVKWVGKDRIKADWQFQCFPDYVDHSRGLL